MRHFDSFNREAPLDSHTPNIPDQSLTSREAASFLAASMRTLEAWRRKGCGPAYIKQGRSVRYRLADLIKFQEAHKITPEEAR